MLRRFVRVIVLCVALYLLIAVVGLIPVNNDFQPTPQGIEVFFVSSAIHADIVLPIHTETIDWREHFPGKCFSGDTSRATHVAIGWGDEAFFVETPTWADMRLSTTAKAVFWPTPSCLHVRLGAAQSLQQGAKSVTISVAQYERLVEYILKSFRKDENDEKIQVENVAYGSDDAFFRAVGAYHCFNTCNCWVGSAMQSAGIRTGWFTPLPKTVFLYLP